MDGGSEPGLAAGERPGVAPAASVVTSASATTGSAISGCQGGMRELGDDGKKIDSGSGGAHVLTSVREAVTSPAQRCVIVRFHACPLGGGVGTPRTPVKTTGRKHQAQM